MNSGAEPSSGGTGVWGRDTGLRLILNYRGQVSTYGLVQAGMAVQALADTWRTSQAAADEARMRMGVMLRQIRRQIPHGGWGRFVAGLGVSRKTITAVMAVAEAACDAQGNIDAEKVARLMGAPSAGPGSMPASFFADISYTRLRAIVYAAQGRARRESQHADGAVGVGAAGAVGSHQPQVGGASARGTAARAGQAQGGAHPRARAGVAPGAGGDRDGGRGDGDPADWVVGVFLAPKPGGPALEEQDGVLSERPPLQLPLPDEDDDYEDDRVDYDDGDDDDGDDDLDGPEEDEPDDQDDDADLDGPDEDEPDDQDDDDDLGLSVGSTHGTATDADRSPRVRASVSGGAVTNAPPSPPVAPGDGSIARDRASFEFQPHAARSSSAAGTGDGLAVPAAFSAGASAGGRGRRAPAADVPGQMSLARIYELCDRAAGILADIRRGRLGEEWTRRLLAFVDGIDPSS